MHYRLLLLIVMPVLISSGEMYNSSTCTASGPLQQYDTVSLADAAAFFRIIAQKYPEDYFRVNTGDSIAFHEYFSSESRKYHLRVAFCRLDTVHNDERAYLLETTDSVIRQYYPGLHFFTGKHWTHYELSVDPVSFSAYLYGDSADMLPPALDKKTYLLSVLGEKQIAGKQNKENVCKALLKAFSPSMHWHSFDYKQEQLFISWIDNNTVSVTGAWKKIVPDTDGFYPNIIHTEMHFGWKDDRLIAWSLQP